MKSRLFSWDIIFCVLVVPGMMFLFPVSDWVQWHPDYVLGYLVWLEGVWFMCRKGVGPLLVQDRQGLALAMGSLFLIGVVTFLMTLTPVDFATPGDGFGTFKLHHRAMWILLLAVVSAGVPVGALAASYKNLNTEKDLVESREMAKSALVTRKVEAFADTGENEILLKAGYRTIHLPLTAIQYIEGRNNYAAFHLDHQEDVVSQIPLKNVMELLPEGKFVRIHRSYIVPVWRIEKRTAAAIKLMGVHNPLPIGRAYKEELKSNK
ncbi:MAG: LytTR family transcriptional regulator [Bacteroidales bacterium]|nr:LytTR family transcriptional regulator [Bacteroidales bacterium]